MEWGAVQHPELQPVKHASTAQGVRRPLSQPGGPCSVNWVGQQPFPPGAALKIQRTFLKREALHLAGGKLHVCDLMALRCNKQPLPPFIHTHTPYPASHYCCSYFVCLCCGFSLPDSPLWACKPRRSPPPPPRCPPSPEGVGWVYKCQPVRMAAGFRALSRQAALVGGQPRQARFTDGERNPERFGDRPPVTEPEPDPGSPALPSGAGPRLPEPGERRAPGSPPANARGCAPAPPRRGGWARGQRPGGGRTWARRARGGAGPFKRGGPAARGAGRGREAGRAGPAGALSSGRRRRDSCSARAPARTRPPAPDRGGAPPAAPAPRAPRALGPASRSHAAAAQHRGGEGAGRAEAAGAQQALCECARPDAPRARAPGRPGAPGPGTSAPALSPPRRAAGSPAPPSPLPPPVPGPRPAPHPPSSPPGRFSHPLHLPRPPPLVSCASVEVGPGPRRRRDRGRGAPALGPLLALWPSDRRDQPQVAPRDRRVRPRPFRGAGLGGAGGLSENGCLERLHPKKVKKESSPRPPPPITSVLKCGKVSPGVSLCAMRLLLRAGEELGKGASGSILQMGRLRFQEAAGSRRWS